MSKRKEYKELTFIDDFMFCKVLTSNLTLCKELLELILEVKIKKVELSESQKTIEKTYDGRGIRLDVYVEDKNNTVYDLEMQTTEQKDLPKRTRYYQGMIDLNLIERGSKFRALKKSYIIFICLTDIFGENLPIYTFENRCIQNLNIKLNDEAYKVIINASGNRKGLSKEMIGFLDFLQGKGHEGNLANKLNDAVETAIENKEWAVDYMTMLMKIQTEREDAAIEATIKSERRHGATDAEIISILKTDYELSESDAVQRLNMFDKAILA